MPRRKCLSAMRKHQTITIMYAKLFIKCTTFSTHQVYRQGASKTTVGSMDKVLSGFPTFNVGGTMHELGFLLYADLFIGSEQLTVNQ